ncbi:MAG: hypothetical protein QNJ16_10495 [Rhodobacter sp.]|nr:hypothetical protein [Rhodobacter sp.]
MEDVFEYGSTSKPGVLAMVGCLAAAGFMAWMAWTNDAGLILNGILRFGVTGASIFYAAMAVAAGGMGVVLLAGMLKPASARAPIRLDQEAITAPVNPGGSKTLRLDYRGITGVAIKSVAGNKVLSIKHPNGSLAISGAEVGGEGFDAMLRSLAARLPRA